MNLFQRNTLIFIVMFYSALGVSASYALDNDGAVENLVNAFNDMFIVNTQVLDVLDFQDLNDVPENPRNTFFKLPRFTNNVHIRPNIMFRKGILRAGIKPRYIETNSWFMDGAIDQGSKENSKFFINECYASLRVLPWLTLAAERKNVQWGNGFIASPSNPFFNDTGKTKPQEEIKGKDFFRITLTPLDWLSITGYANLGRGEQDDSAMNIDKFRRTYAVKANMTFDKFSFSPIISYREHDRVRAGGYGAWTVNEGLLLFWDWSFGFGSGGRYVYKDSDDIFGYVFDDRKKEQDTFYPEILMGGSYTFKNGWTINLEYLYYSPGYDSDEARRYNKLMKTASRASLLEPSSAMNLAYKSYASLPLYYAMENKLNFMREHYFMFYAKKDNIFEHLNLTIGWTQNVCDRSGYFLNLAEITINERMSLIANTFIYTTLADTEYGNPFEFLQTVGVKIYLF